MPSPPPVHVIVWQVLSVTVTATSAIQLPVVVVTRAYKSVIEFRLTVVGSVITVPLPAGSPLYQVTIPISPSNTVLLLVVKSVEVSLVQIINGASTGVGSALIVKVTSVLVVLVHPDAITFVSAQ